MLKSKLKHPKFMDKEINNIIHRIHVTPVFKK